MTPAEHIAIAEKLLGDAASPDAAIVPEEAKEWTLAAIAHALIAIAVESGVPHQSTATGVS